MSSNPGRKNATWSRTPAGWLFKDIIWIYYKQDGLRQTELAERFRNHIPREVYVPIIGQDVTDNAINQRGHKGVFDDNQFEHPDKNPLGLKMLPFAYDVVKKGLTLTKEDVDRIVTEAMSKEEPIEEAPVIPDQFISNTGGYFYVLDAIGSQNCAIGVTGDPDFMKRIRAHSKGDIDGNLRVYRVIWAQDPYKIETYLKIKFKDDRIKTETSSGFEKFEIAPQEMLRQAVLYCNRKQMPHFELTKPKLTEIAA